MWLLLLLLLVLLVLVLPSGSEHFEQLPSFFATFVWCVLSLPSSLLSSSSFNLCSVACRFFCVMHKKSVKPNIATDVKAIVVTHKISDSSGKLSASVDAMAVTFDTAVTALLMSSSIQYFFSTCACIKQKWKTKRQLVKVRKSVVT